VLTTVVHAANRATYGDLADHLGAFVGADRVPQVAGGLRVVAGSLTLNPGSGSCVRDWRDWRMLLDCPSADPWWGYPPLRTLAPIPDGRGWRLHANPKHQPDRIVEFNRADLSVALGAVERDLHGALDRVCGWVRDRELGWLVPYVAASFARLVGLDPAVAPWPAYRPRFEVACMAPYFGDGWIRLHAGMPDADVAWAVARVLTDNGIGADGGLSGVQSRLNTGPPTRPDLGGGITVGIDGARLHPECCCSVRDWRSLAAALDVTDLDLWWGHGPTMHLRSSQAGPVAVVDAHGIPRAEITRQGLRDAMAGIEQDLRGATLRVRTWLNTHAAATDAAAIAEIFPEAVGIDWDRG